LCAKAWCFRYLDAAAEKGGRRKTLVVRGHV
jgi:hypothetical protein